MSAREERKLVTVLFADLVGSTTYAGDRDPERVRVQLERYYDAMRDEIERTGGTVEKFAGDAVMAVFGAPAAFEDHAQRALHAGLAMQQRMTELFADELRMRVGVNTGEVVVGAAREGSSFVTGDAVNVADRLQKAADPDELLAGERTVAMTEGAFELGAPRLVQAKGKADGVTGVPVLRALSVTRPRGVSSGARLFVGRQAELDLLGATYRRALANQEAHLATIVGEPGIGKSRLVLELQRLLDTDDRPVLWLSGGCLAYGDGITYWPVGEVLRQHYGLREGDSPAAVMQRLGKDEILGLALGLDVAGELHPLDARERLHSAIVAFLEDRAAEGPTVLLVEDIHWAEPDLLDLVERIVSDVRGGLLVITTSRPDLLDRRATWGSGQRNTTVLWLDPLPAAAASSLIEAMLPGGVSEDLRRLVVDRADGNPFFLEELVGELVERGAVGGDAHIAIPDTVHAVLAARIDRLPSLEKAALQAAAIVGREFWRAPVVHLVGSDEPDFGLLADRDLISARPRDDVFRFKHALTREVAYGSIPKAQRGRLHASLADWLERTEQGSDERASFLAYHYSEAVDPENADLAWGDAPEELDRLRSRAVHWLSRAGELARGRYEMDEAVGLFGRAAELSSDAYERARLFRRLGEAQGIRYDAEGMEWAFSRALQGPLDDAERADIYAFVAFQASIRSAMFSIRLNRDRIENWARAALALAAPGSEAAARATLALANVEPALATDELLTEATVLAEGLGSVELRSFALGARSQTAFERRRYREASNLSDQRLALAASIDDPDHKCEAYESGAPVEAALGRFDRARELAALHGDLSRRLSAHHRVHTVSLELELAEVLGDWPGMVAATGRVSDLVDANLATPCVRNPRDLLLCAAAHVALGDEPRAVSLEQEATRVAGEGFDSYLVGPRLRIALIRGDRAEADALLELPVERTNVWGVGAIAARIDVLAALRRAELLEREVAGLSDDGSVLAPFALRARGIVRSDDDLLARADDLFALLGLEWHRSQTERLLAGV
jgi:class 3 adenylate cyclase